MKNTPHQKTGPRSQKLFSPSLVVNILHDEFGGTQNDLTEPFCSPKTCNHGRLKNGGQKSKEDLQGESFFRNIHELAKFDSIHPLHACMFSPSIRDVHGNTKKKSLLMVKHLKFPQNLLISRNLLGSFLSNVELQTPNA